MERIVDVTGGQGGNAYLLLGSEKTALIDAGMAYCADKLISNIRGILANKSLDYVFISHSHYDHVGAIPYLRGEWPRLKVLGAEYAKRILAKASAQKTIRLLGTEAATLYSPGGIRDYDAAMLRVDQVVKGGDTLDLGGLVVKVIETKGHTKCSLSFLINDETLFASESTGCISESGKFYPAFITSYTEAVHSINACQAINPRFIISPHHGLVSPKYSPYYWQKCLQAAKETRDFVLHLAAQGYDETRILAEYEKAYRDEHSRSVQPLHAFRLNNQSMIKTVLKEGGIIPWEKNPSTAQPRLPAAGSGIG